MVLYELVNQTNLTSKVMAKIVLQFTLWLHFIYVYFMIQNRIRLLRCRI